MAASTLSLVSGRTFGCSFRTRETVWCDTPASRATSAITGGRDRLPAVAAALTRLLAFSPGDDVTPCLPLPPAPRGLCGQPGPTLALTCVQGEWRCYRPAPPTATCVSIFRRPDSLHLSVAAAPPRR